MEVTPSEKSFAATLQAGNLARITAFAKADRHCHSGLSASLQSIEKWAGASIRKAPARMGSFDQMRQYMHEVLYPYIDNRPGIEFTAEQSIREAIQDGVTVLEMSLDVRFIRSYPAHGTGFFDFIRTLRGKYARSIDFRPEIGISKNRPPLEEIPLALDCLATVLFKSIDLYGNEDAHPPEAYKALYQEAKRLGVKLKAHVGEFGNA